MDAPWPKAGEESGLQAIEALPLRQLAHAEGCHYWIWCPWSLIRRGTIQRFFQAWELKWVAELIWDRGEKNQGRWFYSRTEVLVLASFRGLPLLRSDVPAVHAFERGRVGERPGEFRRLIEELSPGPRVELYAKGKAEDWEQWRR